MSQIYCADCRQWEPCRCTKQSPNKTLLFVGAGLRVAKFYFATPSQKRNMIQDMIDRFNKINRLHTEQTQNNTASKKYR